jgi:hypothetical protein
MRYSEHVPWPRDDENEIMPEHNTRRERPIPRRVSADGLISYGSHHIDPYRRAVDYVDRILKGEKPTDLPVQGPVIAYGRPCP